VDYLREFLDRTEVQDAIGLCRGSRVVQGVGLEIDDFWLSAWRAAARENPLQPAEAPGLVEGIRWLNEGVLSVQTARVAAPLGHPAPIRPLRAADLEWIPPGWDNHMRANVGNPESPVQLRIFLYPEFGRDPEATLPELSELPINYVFESRPVPRLAAARSDKLDPLIGGGSIGIGAKAYGTLGGLVRDKNKQHYGVTCAHVTPKKGAIVHQPSQYDAGAAHPIGRVAHAQLPTEYPHSLPITAANQGANSNDVDVALIEIDQNVAAELAVDTLGPITGLFPNTDIQQWHPAIFAGRTSNVRSVEFLVPTAFYNVPNATGTGTTCFNNVRLVQWEPGAISNGQPPIQAGDSGAWLCVGGPNGYEWAAMIIAWEPRMGFAISASAIENWWQHLGLSLSPV
jgi:hypothetical protein